MLEFLEDDVPKEVFTFSVPPESEDFAFPQRITETKTFGGSAFDDYGNDTISITLSGTTINEEKKLIYKGFSKLPKYLTGEKEIFHLQQILSDWGEIEKVPKKKVYLYDLSKMSLIQLAQISGGGAPSRNYWRVAIKQLRIRRDKSKPLTFNYTLEMTGFIDEKPTGEGLFPEGVNDVLDKIQNVMDAIQEVMGYVEFAAAAFDSVAGGIKSVKTAFEKIGKADWTTPAGIAKNTGNIVDSSLRIVTGGSNNSVYNTSKSLVASVNKLASLGASPEEEQKGAEVSQGDVLAVSFNTAGGSYIAPSKVKYGNVLTPPHVPTKPKYEFIGWYEDSALTAEFDITTEITENITLYAKWNQVSASVTFNSRQGSSVPDQSVKVGELVTLPEPPTRNNYVFEYWCTDTAAENEYNFSAPVAGDLTLYAKWRTVYTVTFNSNGGSPVQAQVIEVGGKVIYPSIPQRDNYLFMCWSPNPKLSGEYNFNSVLTGNITLYAKWTQITNTVRFETNGGGVIDSQSVNIGGYATKPTDPEKEGHIFARWCNDPALTNEFIFDTTAVNSPLVIYAKWDVKIFSVTFETDGGGVVSPQMIEYKKRAVYPINPVKAGHLFRRWCTDETLETEFDFSAAITENITLYAEWVRGQP
jgi:uncharacterized repeat protein (TIGR02543 family)